MKMPQSKAMPASLSQLTSPEAWNWTTDAKLDFQSVEGDTIRKFLLEGKEIPDFLKRGHERAFKGEEVRLTMPIAGELREIYLRPLRHISGEVLGVMGTATPFVETPTATPFPSRDDVLLHTLEALPIAVCIARLDRAQSLCYANPAFKELLELTGSRMQEFSIEQLTTSRSHLLVLQKEVMLNGGGGESFDIQLSTKRSKRKLWLNAATQLIFFEDEAALLFMFNDVTFRRSEGEKWKNTLSHAPDYIFQISTQGEITYFNRPLPGCSKAAMNRGLLRDFLPPESRFAFDRAVKRLSQLHKGTAQETFNVTFHAEHESSPKLRHTMQFRVAPIRSQGRLQGLAVIASDITELKERERQIAESEAHNKALVKASPDLVLLYNFKGEILDVKSNADFETLIPVNEAPQSLTEVLPSSDTKRFLEKSMLAFKEQKTQTVRFVQQTHGKNGQFYEARIRAIGGRNILAVVRNITEIKRAEQNAVLQRQHYLDLIENIEEIVFTFSDTLKGGFITKQVRRILGYNPEDFMGQFSVWLKNVHTDDQSKLEEAVRGCIQEQKHQRVTYRMRHKTNGKYLWLENTLVPRYGEKGEFSTILGVARDISERVAYEQERNKLVALVENSHEFVGIVEQSGHFSFINSTGKKMLELPESFPVSELSAFELFPDRPADFLRDEVYDRLHSQEKSNSWESEMLLASPFNTQHHDVFASFYVIHSRPDAPPLLALIVRDLGEQKHLERVVHRSEARYRTLIETMNEAVLVVDSELHVRFVNQRLCSLTGYEVKTLEGQEATHLLCYDAAHQQRMQEALIKAAEQGTQKIEVHLRTKYGEDIWALMSCTNLEDDSYSGRILAVLTDITEQKRTETRLLEVNAEMERLLYRASHDLKGPLSSTQGLINIIELELGQVEGVGDYISMMRTSLGKLSNSVKGLIDIAKIKQGQVNPQEIRLHDLLTDVIQAYTFSPLMKNAEVSLVVPKDFTLKSDPELLSTILQNLLENSLKYYDAKKALNKVIFKAEQRTEGVFISVCDNGRGIPHDQQAHIFDMFSRVHEDAQGSGLGLYMVQNALKKLHAKVTVESAEREGTCFLLHFPQQLLD